jgi:hypothetical protein
MAGQGRRAPFADLVPNLSGTLCERKDSQDAVFSHRFVKTNDLAAEVEAFNVELGDLRAPGDEGYQ